MARHKVKVLEGGEVRESLVPFATVYEYADAHDGMSYNEAIAGGIDVMMFAPWVAWHALTFRGEEDRPFDEFVRQIEWVTLLEAPDELDPSGGESTQQSSSPESSPAPTSGGKSSSRSRTGSKKPSGASSTG